MEPSVVNRCWLLSGMEETKLAGFACGCYAEHQVQQA